jgi:hypothetical protein
VVRVARLRMTRNVQNRFRCSSSLGRTIPCKLPVHFLNLSKNRVKHFAACDLPRNPQNSLLVLCLPAGIAQFLGRILHILACSLVSPCNSPCSFRSLLGSWISDSGRSFVRRGGLRITKACHPSAFTAAVNEAQRCSRELQIPNCSLARNTVPLNRHPT